jgi:hypothetical protein
MTGNHAVVNSRDTPEKVDTGAQDDDMQGRPQTAHRSGSLQWDGDTAPQNASSIIKNVEWICRCQTVQPLPARVSRRTRERTLSVIGLGTNPFIWASR